MPTVKKKLKKKRKASFTLPKTSHKTHYVPSSTWMNNNARNDTWIYHNARAGAWNRPCKHVRNAPTYKGNGSGLNFNRLMNLNNRVVAKLNVVEISRWSQYHQQVCAS